MCTLSTSVLECDGKAVQTAETSRNIAAGGEYEFIQKVKITNPSLLVAGKSLSVHGAQYGEKTGQSRR